MQLFGGIVDDIVERAFQLPEQFLYNQQNTYTEITKTMCEEWETLPKLTKEYALKIWLSSPTTLYIEII